MKISNSIFFSTLLGLSSIGLFAGQGQALTTYADADSTAFDAAVAALGQPAPPFTFDFESAALNSTPGTYATGTGQFLTITGTPQSRLRVRGRSFAASPLDASDLQSNSAQQIAVTSPNNSSTFTTTFSLAYSTNYFGIYIGDQFDISDTSRYSLSNGNGDFILNNVAFSTGGSFTDQLSFTDTQGTEDLTVGNNAYNFFGIVDPDNSFSEVTLTMFDPSGGNEDNFVFDSITASSVPFEFSPSLGLVIVGLGFGALKYRQAKLGNKDLS